MKAIPLTQGMVALVDDEDFEALARYKWSAHANGRLFYARRRIHVSGKEITVLMHREILGLHKGHLLVDHRDGNPLNNTRANLRLATHAENLRNRGRQSNNTSGYKGVWKHATRWKAGIWLHREHYYLGCFTTAIDAAFVYDFAALKLHGEFARTNFFSGSAR